MGGIDPTWPPEALRLIEGLLRRVTAVEGVVRELQEKSAKQERRIERLKKENKRLKKKLDEALRAGKRQASPFSKGDPKPDPKKSGRKKGDEHGPAFRPPPDQVDESHVAALPLDCPHCGGEVEVDSIESQFQWELPEDIRALIREFKVQIGHCSCCHERLQGRHPLQTSDALGRAACQIGPHALATAAHMNKVLGVPYGKISSFFSTFFHLNVATSTLVRATLRLGKKAEPAYARIRDLVRSSVVVYPDETGWRIRGQKAWLHVFVGVREAGTKVALYVIARYRGFSVSRWALGPNFEGLLGHDGWAPYDRFEQAEHQQCLSHLLRRCNELLEIATRRAVSFPRDLKEVLKDAFAVRDRYLGGEVSYRGLQIARGRLESRLDQVLDMRLTHADNKRLAKHVGKHRGEIFTFLKHPDWIEGTNAFAEQETRPAVIARKMSGCNRSWAGARAHEILVTWFRTMFHAGESGIGWLVEALRHPGPTGPRLPALLDSG